MKASGVQSGDRVLLNAFTLAPAPGAIHHAGAKPLLVDITDDYVIDLDDPERKARDSGARYVLMSYMRGHFPDMDALMRVCQRRKLILIEDCAHTMGEDWDGQPLGTFGRAGAFSTQTFKHINSGEGGLLLTDDEDLAARAVLLSGSYMLYDQHRSRPPLAVFERHRLEVPNYSMRMSGLAAAVLRPQLRDLEARKQRWLQINQWMLDALSDVDAIHIPRRPPQADFLPSSLQFSLVGSTANQLHQFVAEADAHGVHLKWFGRDQPEGFTSRPDHWGLLEQFSTLKNAPRVLGRLCDMRLPIWLSRQDCETIARVLREALDRVCSGAA